MLTPIIRLLPLTLLLAFLAVCGCGNPAPSPMVWVLKEGVFEITPDKPFVLSHVIESGKSNATYEITIEVKVRYGDGVTVATTTKLDDGSEFQMSRLSQQMHIKGETKLIDLIRESASNSTVINIVIPTSGTSSEASIKITKLLK
jgi:hypothetical protein